MSKLKEIAEKICNLKHGGNSNVMEAAWLEFFKLVGEAFQEIDNSLEELKKANGIGLKRISSHEAEIEKAKQPEQKVK